jgi:hypothetical protein
MAGNALDSIEAALTAVVNNKHLSAAQLKSAKTVAASVEATVTELESAKGKQLSKEARAAKVTAAIKELQSLQDEWQKTAAQAVSQKKADLMKQLASKEAELAKEQKMLKVINLEKALAEKKLALEKLVEMKNARERDGAQKEAQKEAIEQQEMVANVLNMAKSLQGGQGANTSTSHTAAKAVDAKPALLKIVLAHLEGRMQNVTASIQKIDAAEKKHEAELKDAMKAPKNGNTDAIGKGASLLKILLKKEHRQFDKSRATLKSEYKELHEAVSSIKKGDVAGLTKVMAHMQGEMKASQAKSQKFLY